MQSTEIPSLRIRTLAAFAIGAAVIAMNPATATNNEQRSAAAQKLHEKFDAADTNRDGYLSRDEAAKGMPRAAAVFDEIDTDHDGRLTRAEITAYLVKTRAARAK
jgi:Ca2+-binding EF-hand superfamily protein